MRGLRKGLRGSIESQLGKGLTGICRSANGLYTNRDLAEGRGFSCEGGGNWTSGEGQGMGCVAFGAWDIHSSTTRTKKGGDRTISPYFALLIILQEIADFINFLQNMQRDVRYSARNFAKLFFCDVAKLRNVKLPMARKQTDKIYFLRIRGMVEHV